MSTRKQVGERISLTMQEVIASAVLTNERIARSIGLNVVDFQTYGVLLRNAEPMTPGQVAQATELPSSTTTRVLDRLEAKGMVERRPDPGDRRKVWVHPVQFHDARVESAYADIVRQMEDVHAGYTVAELQTVLRYLSEIKNVR
ncbi:MarR family winged helix-turn-helix transcriptional regulator [Nocardioides sp.]|uniref:MarR family winged helix-turn-helix transcriptional regulator n=1 Tax=Nocardioides sp. TaxID=35761 RepID=UPI002F40C60F